MPDILINIQEIEVKDRIREQPGTGAEMREMMESLEELGQLQPIVIDGNRLMAGFRRYSATALLMAAGRTIGGKLPEGNERRLDLGQIRATQWSDLDPITRLRVEIEENKKRKDFSKAEEALGIAKMQALMTQLHPEGKVPTARQMAKEMGVSQAHVTMGLRVAEAVNAGNKELLNSDSVFGAYQKLNTMEKLAGRKAQINASGSVKTFDGLVHGDALEWIKTIEDESIDFWNFDPPWGIGVDDYDRQHKYEEWEDDSASAQKLTVKLIPHLYRSLKPNSYMVVWFGIQYYEQMTQLLSSAGFKVDPVPSLWHKPNKGGSQNDSSRFLLNVYETFFVCMKGDPRMFKKAQTNMLSYNMPPRDDRFHFAQKSVELMQDILERYTFSGMRVGDPTFGSGAVFKAALKLGHTIVGCEKNAENHRKAVEWLNEMEPIK